MAEGNGKFRWYVYHLIDPRDGSIFYVGKGRGNRIAAHEKEARSGKAKNLAKIGIIRQIWAAGLEVIREIVCWFAIEAEAYRFERSLIAEINPRGNIASGTTKIIKFSDLLFRIISTWEDRREEMQRMFPRGNIPAHWAGLYDALMVSPRFENKAFANGG